MRPFEQALRKLVPPNVEIGSAKDGPHVAIVGGGVIGWSAAYHILKMNPDALVAVFEELGASGLRSTGRAAGGVRAQFGTAINIELSQFSKRAFQNFQSDIGVDIAFHQRGYLFLTATESGRQYLETVVPLQQSLDVASRLVTPSDIADLAPYLRCDDLVAGSYCADDGYLDPYAVCAGYEAAATRLGAIAVHRTVVTDACNGQINLLRFRASEVDQVCPDSVVLACGHLTERLLGKELPVRPVVHQLALTEPIPGLPRALPMIVDLDTTFHFRSEGDGLLIGFSDPRCAERSDDPTASPPFDEKFLEAFAEVGMHRLPALNEARFDSKKSWAGFYAETPDHHAIIGQHNGAIIATGFGGHGIMHSPAAGQAVAELVLAGRCSTFDLRPLRPSRFAEGDLTLEPMVI